MMVAFCTAVQKASEIPRSSFLIPRYLLVKQSLYGHFHIGFGS